ncbi:MAG: hypothetical protein JNG84_07465 [Archangium sp.]|nr:hypothetical protein [Archangium sp.]
MNTPSRFLAAFALTAVMSGSGCVCVIDGTNRSGNITYLWTFGGQPCAVVRDVATVRISMPGQVLQNGGVYGCLNGTPGTPGITLFDFRPGTYQYTIEGLSNVGQVIYAATGTVTVAGDVTESVDLQPTTAATGSALVTWRFPAAGASASPGCAGAIPGAGETTAGISFIDLVIDGAAPVRQACASGIAGTQGVQLSNLAAGAHTVELRSVGASGFQYHGVINTLTIMAGGTVAAEFQLQWVTGSLPIKWQFVNTTLAQTCAQAGVTTVFINLRDAQGSFLYADAGIDFPCSNLGVQGATFPYLTGGTYQLYLQGIGAGNTLYRSNQLTPPTAAVTAGAFPQVDGSTFAVEMRYP